MADDVATVVLRVQAGQAPAFIELVQRLNAELRAWIATYAVDAPMIDDVALAVWCAVRRAPSSCPAAPMPWILAFAERELAQRLTAVEDDPLRQALMHAAAAELRAAGQPSTTAAQHVQRRLAMMPPMARRLLNRHYGERLPLADLAVAQGVSNEDVADSLVMARSTLDWHPDAMAGPVAHGPFSAVIEDFLGGDLGGEPRQRFAAHLAADAERSATFVRQTRLDLMLRVMLAPVVEGEGKVMAQAAWATVASGDGLMIAQPPELRPRPAAPAGHGSDRTQRRPTSSDLGARRASEAGTRRITANEPTTRRISATEPGSRRHSHQRLDGDAAGPAPRRSGLLVVLILAGLALAGGVAVLALWGRGEAPRPHAQVAQADPAPVAPAPPAPAAGLAPGPVPSPGGARADGPVTFVRGINFGGDPVIIDRHRWLAQDQAVAGGLVLTAEAVATSIPPLSGAGFDFDGKAMLESGLSAKEAPLRLRQALPPGTYEVVLWVAGPDAGNPLAITIGDQIGNVAAAPSATWRKLGPYRVTLAGAQFDLVVAGLGRAHLSGMTLATVGKPSAPLPPIALLISPTDRFAQDSTRSLDLVADVIPAATPITSVAFMDGDKVLATVTAPPYRLSIPKLPPGTFSFTVVATAADGGRASSSVVGGTILDLPVGTGTILRERWNGLGGQWLRDSAANPKLNGPPDQSSLLTAMKTPTDDGFDFVDRLRGFLVPPVTGSYTFWIASDDNSELYLSSDEDPAHLQPQLCWSTVVREEGWDERPEQRSRPIALEAGRRYFVEVRHKQGPGGTHLAVGWQLPDGYRERPIPGARLAPWTAAAAPQVAVAPPAPAPAPAPAPSTPPAAVEKAPRFALGIDFGGEGVVIDGNRWLSQHQAEELETPLVITADTFLSELPLADAQVGFGGLRRDVDLDGRPLTIGKATYKRGLFTHAPATILVPLDGRSTQFVAEVGVESYVGQGSVTFEVYLDDVKVAESGVVRLGDEAKHLDVPLGKGKVLKLVVGDAGDGLAGDHAIWGDARLTTPHSGQFGPAAGLKAARRVAQNYATKPPSEGALKSMLNSSSQGRGEALAFGLKVPNGTYDAWFWVSENAGNSAHLFDLDVQGVALKGLGALPSGGWSKYGPLRVSVANGVLAIVAKAGKGVPTLSGMALFAIDP